MDLGYIFHANKVNLMDDQEPEKPLLIGYPLPDSLQECLELLDFALTCAKGGRELPNGFGFTGLREYCAVVLEHIILRYSAQSIPKITDTIYDVLIRRS